MVHGGVTYREGLRFVASTKDSTKKARLIRFKFSVEQAYIIEAGHQYFRFYMDGGQIEASLNTPYEIASPYTESDLPLLQYTQSADVLYIVHPAHPPRTLSRTGHTAWSLAGVQFDPAPSFEAGLTPATALTIPDTTVGADRTMTVAVGTFLASDVGREIVAGLGRASITEVVSATSIKAEITAAFPASPMASGSWKVTGSPVTTCDPTDKGPVGKITTLTLAAAGWRAADVGKFARVNGGTVRITSVSSATVASGKILAVMSVDTVAGEGTWRIEDAAWSTTLGYPGSVTFHQGRIWYGGVTRDPAVVYGSQSDDFDNFAVGDSDADSVVIRLAADDVHAVRWLRASGKALAVGTDGGVWSITSGAQDPTITPTTVNASLEVTDGAAEGMGAVRVGADTVYLHRFRKRMMSLRYSFESDAYEPSDLTTLAEHITGTGVTAWAWQDSPERTFWLVRDDGVLLALTYYPQHDVVGWARHITDGVVESIACIPGAVGDELYVIVRRTVGGQQVRYVERLVADDTIYLDSSLSYDGAPVSSVSGLSHLEGREVAVMADGSPIPSRVVTDGSVTLDAPASKVHVGLPYRALLEPTDPDLGAVNGSAQGRRKRIIEVAFDVLRSAAAKYGPDEDHLNLMEGGPPITAFDTSRALKTGQMRCPFNGDWSDELKMVVVHDTPIPFMLRSLCMFFEVTDK